MTLSYALILSRLGLALGITALILSWVANRSRWRWRPSKVLVWVLAMIGLSLVVLSWGWALTNRQP
jgi:hypothetical protein